MDGEGMTYVRKNQRRIAALQPIDTKLPTFTLKTRMNIHVDFQALTAKIKGIADTKQIVQRAQAHFYSADKIETGICGKLQTSAFTPLCFHTD